MTHALNRKIGVATAIAAVLALGSTPAWAQEAAPAVDLPAAGAPQPTIVLPADPPAPPAPATASRPVIQPVPAAPVGASVDEPARAREPAARRTVTRAAARPAADASPRAVAPTDVAPADPVNPPPAVDPAVATPPAASVPLAQPAADRAPAETAAASDTPRGVPDAAWIAGLLVALGGAGAWLATRRRRPVETVAAERDDAPPPRPVLPAYATVEDVAGTPVVRREAEAARLIGEEELAPATQPAASMAVDVALDGPVPQTRAERDALLERMVAAAPDEANPFTSRKARMRRARLILQRLDHEQKDGTTQPFDWRTYKPSARHPAPATPPRVTV